MKCALFGSLGRMGSLVRQEADGRLEIVAAYDTVPPALLADVPLPPDVDVVIDFSTPLAWKDLDRLLEPSGAMLVTGTTGLGPGEDELLTKWSTGRAVFRASNMSRGVYVMGKLLGMASQMLGEDFDLELVEIHHRHKEDSPSGTALELLEIWQERHQGELIHGRQGCIGPRRRGEIGVHSVRGGDVPGDHELHILGPGERLLLVHRATDRSTFASGAVMAAEWLAGRAPGLYGMRDMMEGDG
jgi:4-hydroxy-tetrahydrodipicolinate reductase